MASFVEQATLLVKDQSSAKIAKINRELNQLFKTAQKLSKLSINLKGLGKATSEVHKLNNELGRVGRKPINMRVHVQGTQQARAQIDALARDRRTILSSSGADLWGRTAGTALGIALHGAIRSVAEAFRVGSRAQDIAETRLDLLNLNPQERAQVDQAINLVVADQRAQPRGATLNRQQVEQLMAEALPGVVGEGGKLNVDATRFMVEQVSSLIELQVASGVEAQQAIGRAQDFVKALVASNRVFDPKTQLFDRALAEQEFNLMRQLAPVIGEEFTGPFVRQMLANAPRLRGTLSDPALAKMLMLAEEDRTKIFTSMETLGNSLFTVERSAKGDVGKSLVEAGFRTKSGKTTSGVNQKVAEFAKDPFSVYDEVIAFMKLNNLNPDVRADVDVASRLLVPTSRAGGALATIVTQARSLENQFAQLSRTTGTVEETRKNTAESLVLSELRLQNAFQGLAGQATRLAEPILIPAMDAITKNLSAFAEGEVPSPAVIASSAATLAAASVMAVPLGGMAGMTALTTGHGNTNQLLGAIAVNTAATAANTAVGGLGDLGKAVGIGGILRFLGRGGFAAAGLATIASYIQPAARRVEEVHGPAPRTPAEMFSKWWKKVDDATKRARLLAEINRLAQVPVTGPGPTSVVDKSLFPTRSFLIDAAGKELAKLGDLTSSANGAAKAIDQFAAKLSVPTAVEELQSREAFRLSKLTPEQQWREQLKMSRQSDQLQELVASGKLNPEQISQARRYLEELNALLQVSTPPFTGFPTTPETVPLPPSRLSPVPDQIQQLMQTRDAAMSQVQASFDTSADNLVAAGNTLPAKGTEFGSNANAAINASGLGTAFGTAAAAQIRNAASSIRVNVNVAGSVAADTGAMAVPS